MALDPHINPQTNVWDDNYYANTGRFQSGGDAGDGGLNSTIQRAIEMQRQAIQPSIQALQQQTPLIQQAYQQKQSTLEQQKPILEQRYQNLLGELSRREGIEKQQVQQRTAQEFGYRGIPTSSTYYGDTLQQVQQPISQFYTGQTKDVGLAQQQDLQSLAAQIAGIPVEQAQSLNQIQQAIAQVESGAATGGIQSGISMYDVQRQAQMQAQELALRQQQALSQQQLQGAQANYYNNRSPLLDAQTQLALERAGKLQIGSGSNLPSLESIFGE